MPINLKLHRHRHNNITKQQEMNSYPFLETTDTQSCHEGPAANSTMLNGKTVIDPDLTLVPKPKLPRTALGFAGLTYMPGISETLTSQLRKHAPDLKLAPRPPNKVSQVFTDMKHKLELGQHSLVVYQIKCKHCSNMFYYGETSRCLCERCHQHEQDVANLPKNPKKTALVAHVHETGHEFDFEHPKIMKKVRSRGLLKIHEANQIILNEETAVNFKKDAKHVSPVFYNLIKKSAEFSLFKKSRNRTPSIVSPFNATRQSELSQNEISASDV